MNITAISNTQPVKQTSFKSTIVPTKYLEETLDYAISKHCCQGKFLEALKKILNDGKKDIVKFDLAKGFIKQKLFPGAFNITVNGEKRPWNCYFGTRNRHAQCEYAVIDYAKDIDYVEKGGLIEKIKTRYQNAWEEWIMHNCYDMEAQKADKHMKKKVDYLRKLYNKTLSEELFKVKLEIFKNNM